MTVVRPPKKLRDLCERLRGGFDPVLLPSRDQFPKHEAQVDAVHAQAAVFGRDWTAARELCQASVLASDQWYSSNFLQANLAALTFMAIRTDTRPDAQRWLSEWLDMRSSEPEVPDHVLGFLRRQVEIQELAMAGEPTGLTVRGEAASPEPMSSFIDQLATHREGVSPESAAGIDYMLHFIATRGSADDFLEQYARAAEETSLAERHHVTAGRILAARGDARSAQDALLRWCAGSGWAIEVTDILPMEIFTFFDLYPVLSDEFLGEIREQ